MFKVEVVLKKKGHDYLRINSDASLNKKEGVEDMREGQLRCSAAGATTGRAAVGRRRDKRSRRPER